MPPNFQFHRGYVMFGGGPNDQFVHFVLLLIFLVVVAAIAFVILRHFTSEHHGHAAHTAVPAATDEAIDVLKMRFAKGEIDDEEFTTRLGLLQGSK